MPAPSPTSPLESPDWRRGLQQRLELAQRLAGAERPDFPRIHELLAECLRGDPGSTLYLGRFLANLRRWNPPPTRDGWFAWLRGSPDAPPLPPLDSAESALALLRQGPERLKTGHADPKLLCHLAAACELADLPETELAYLRAALEVDSADIATWKQLALALTRQGRFDEALPLWRQASELAPGDPALRQALSDLNPAEPAPTNIADLHRAVAADPTNAPRHLALVEALLAAARFGEAENCLLAAQGACGSDFRLLAAREELQLARARRQIELARRRAKSDPHPRAGELAEHLEAEHHRLAIEILHLRCERLPGEMGLRVELAKLLKQAGNFSGAIQRLEEARRDPAWAAAALLELGECWQHLRQYAKALEFYRQAAANPSPPAPLPEGERGTETHLAALYRLGVLAAAMNRPDEAASALRMVIDRDADYKDAKTRLRQLTGE
ncbi:MAG: tetratricopeptide repeat protein [Pirellulaceae bacterium]|nr:tetratricopeptide repeat protein [Pirellulaceae bacterium]